MADDTDPTTAAQIGRRLHLTRRVLNLSQTELTERARISRTAYVQYEGGSIRPSLETAIALHRTYRLTLDWIYLGDPSGLPYHLAAAIKALEEAERQ